MVKKAKYKIRLALCGSPEYIVGGPAGIQGSVQSKGAAEAIMKSRASEKGGRVGINLFGNTRILRLYQGSELRVKSTKSNAEWIYQQKFVNYYRH